MISDLSPPSLFPFLRFWPCKKSHRTLPEQLIGLSIFLLVSLGFSFLNAWVVAKTEGGMWYQNLVQPPWAFDAWPKTWLWGCYHAVLAGAIWTLWRSRSLRTLKPETALFASGLILESISALSFFGVHETLVSLIFALLLFCNTLLSALLFWKKEPLSGQLMLLAFFWIFYYMGINMAICILNPKV